MMKKLVATEVNQSTSIVIIQSLEGLVSVDPQKIKKIVIYQHDNVDQAV